jgi:hypothetical protein
MDKLAQSKRETGRGFFNQLRETVNRPGAFLEGIFRPELERVMVQLTALDDRIRSEITGKKIGVSETPAIQTSAKDLLKAARTAFNRREYMTGVSDLAMFHKKMQAMSKDIDKFFVDVNKIHHKFLFDGVDEEKIKRLREHMEPKAASVIADQLLKEAGLVDSLLNFVTRRGRGLAAWEKKYPKETKALRDGGTKLLDHADSLLAHTISVLKEMASARATRRPDEYMDLAAQIKAEFNKFDAAFKAYYQNAITPWMRIKDEVEAAANRTQGTGTDAPAPGGPPEGKVELGAEPEPPPAGPSSPGPSSPVGTPLTGVPPMGGGFVTFKPTGLPSPAPKQPPPASEEEAPPTIPEAKVRVAPEQPKIRVGAHKKFYQSLEAMSQEDPRILCSYIAKYATSIQGDDPETAIALFSIVKKLKG